MSIRPRNVLPPWPSHFLVSRPPNGLKPTPPPPPVPSQPPEFRTTQSDAEPLTLTCWDGATCLGRAALDAAGEDGPTGQQWVPFVPRPQSEEGRAAHPG